MNPIRPRDGSTSIRPSVGASRPAQSRSSVDFPEPFGPVTTRNPPRSSSKLTSRSTGLSRKRLPTPFERITGRVYAAGGAARRANASGTMVPVPLRADAARNRAAILTAARRAFAELGTAAGMAGVARAAGVGVGTLYRRFPTKEALVQALLLDRL